MSGDLRHTIGRAAIAVAVCAVLLGIAAGCGGGGSDDTVDAATKKEQPETGPTVAVMKPLGSSEASGTATYVKQSSGVPLFKLELQGLEPSVGRGQYLIWQMESRDNMVVIATFPAEKDGRIDEKFAPNPVYLAAVEAGEKKVILVTRVENWLHFREKFSERDGAWNPNIIGEPVLRGTFAGPLVGVSEDE
ncbi:MAG TPA: hypothetical protein VFN92_08635 [Solirubrobacterales bacterium]|nr:hypothetical protein [Solirubrobacterales bacterium]